MKEYNHPNESVCDIQRECTAERLRDSWRRAEQVTDVLVGHQLPPSSPRLKRPRL